MKNWFTSLNGAITLSVITLITQVWRGFLDAMLVFPNDFGERSLMEIVAVVYTALFALWAWSLISARGGSRRGLIAAFALNILIWVAIPVSWLFFYCPAECRAGVGIFNLANSLNLIFGLLAAISLGLQFRRSQQVELA
jgi:hypothetical protein